MLGYNNYKNANDNCETKKVGETCRKKGWEGGIFVPIVYLGYN